MDGMRVSLNGGLGRLGRVRKRKLAPRSPGEGVGAVRVSLVPSGELT